jgi:hypothetical protein
MNELLNNVELAFARKRYLYGLVANSRGWPGQSYGWGCCRRRSIKFWWGLSIALVTPKSNWLLCLGLTKGYSLPARNERLVERGR